MSDSLKNQAEQMMQRVANDVAKLETEVTPTVNGVKLPAKSIFDRIFTVIDEVDFEAAQQRVKQLRDQLGNPPSTVLLETLIRRKCQQTGAIGALTAGPSVIPIVGTIAAMTVGTAADIGATIKLQTELVAEVAAVYGVTISDAERRKVVLLLIGFGIGPSVLARQLEEGVSYKLSEQFIETSLLKLLPLIGMVACAGTNVLATYLVGRRADVYFRVGAQALNSWRDDVRAVTGLDEQKIIRWLNNSSQQASSSLISGAITVGEVIASGIDHASQVGRSAGAVVGSTVTTTGKLAVAGTGLAMSVPLIGVAKLREVISPTKKQTIVEGRVMSKIDVTTQNSIYPLTFAPVFRDYIWGGRNLETKLGRQIPDGVIAESWEISGHPSSPTEVDNGSLAGKSLPDLVTELGLNLVGQRAYPMLKRGKFPLLIKLLDANKPLSVQVHPNDEYANQHENGELGKTEMWYILHAKPDAHLIYGLAKDGISRNEFAEAAKSGQLEPYMHRLPIKTGDAVFIPSGSLHAILDGIIIAEIQQNSDTTYRVYDWNRVGNDGKPRPLHIDKAVDVINFEQVQPTAYPVKLLPSGNGVKREEISACPYFHVERVTFEAGAKFAGQCDGNSFEIWGVMSGGGQINWSGEPLNLSAVRFSLLPAMLGEFEVQATQAGEWLRVYLP